MSQKNSQRMAKGILMSFSSYYSSNENPCQNQIILPWKKLQRNDENSIE